MQQKGLSKGRGAQTGSVEMCEVSTVFEKYEITEKRG